MEAELEDKANCSETPAPENVRETGRFLPCASEGPGPVNTVEIGCLESGTVTEDNSSPAETQLVSRDDPQRL